MNVFKRHRLANGLTLRELAQRIGVAVGTCGHWETGRTSPSPRIFKKLAKVLNVPPMNLVKEMASDQAHAA